MLYDPTAYRNYEETNRKPRKRRRGEIQSLYQNVRPVVLPHLVMILSAKQNMNYELEPKEEI